MVSQPQDDRTRLVNLLDRIDGEHDIWDGEWEETIADALVEAGVTFNDAGLGEVTPRLPARPMTTERYDELRERVREVRENPYRAFWWALADDLTECLNALAETEVDDGQA